MKIEYDKFADAAYIYLSERCVHHTVRVTSSINLDIDKKGGLIGIEILDASHQVPKSVLKKSSKIGVNVFA